MAVRRTADGRIWVEEPPVPWSAEESAILRELWPAHGKSWSGWRVRLPMRSADAIASRARKMGLRRQRRPWTREEVVSLFSWLRGASKACGHEPAECVRALETMVRLWEQQGSGSGKGGRRKASDRQLLEMLAESRAGATDASLARRHGVAERTMSKWLDEASVLEALRSVM